MQIYGAGGVHGAQPITSPHTTRRVDGPQQTSSLQPTDELTLSSEASFVDAARSLPDVRQDRIDAIKQQIADGTYESDAKLDAALDALLDEIA
jgi:negative regulator of flagellin synthesis FlgM